MCCILGLLKIKYPKNISRATTYLYKFFSDDYGQNVWHNRDLLLSYDVRQICHAKYENRLIICLLYTLLYTLNGHSPFLTSGHKLCLNLEAYENFMYAVTIQTGN